MLSSQNQYVKVNDSESCEDAESAIEPENARFPRSLATTSTDRAFRRVRMMIVVCGTCVFFAVALLYAIPPGRNRRNANTSTYGNGQPKSCISPVIRQEWRDLSISQRLEYISAVQCLQSRPSRLGLDHTLHDEFTWVHSRLGNFSKANLQQLRRSESLTPNL
jgi:hypothetical protein